MSYNSGYSGGGGGGGVGGSTGATDNAILRADGTGGATAQSSTATISDNGELTLTAATASSEPLNIVGAASQTGNLTEWRDSGGTIGVFIPPVNTGGVAGQIGLGTEGSGKAIRALTGIQLVDNFNTVVQGTLYGESFIQNAYGIIRIRAATDLTDATAVTIHSVSCPTMTSTGGMLTCKIFATDGTDVQTRTQLIRWEAVNKGGAYTTAVTVISEGAACSAGTLTGTWSITTGSDVVNLRLTADTSLASTTTFTVKTIDSSM